MESSRRKSLQPLHTNTQISTDNISIMNGEVLSLHYNDVIIVTIASQITSRTIVYSIVYSVADQRKHQSSASLAFVRGIHRGPVNSLHKWPVTWKMFPFDDVIMMSWLAITSYTHSFEIWRKMIFFVYYYIICNFLHIGRYFCWKKYIWIWILQ